MRTAATAVDGCVCGVLRVLQEGASMRPYVARWVLAVAALTAPAEAQTLDVHAGRLVDPASGKVLPDQRVRIVDGRFASVGAWRDADGPATVDWSGYTVLPGLIDLH